MRWRAMGGGGSAGGGEIAGAYTPALTPWYGVQWLPTNIQSYKPANLYHDSPYFGPLTVIYGTMPDGIIYGYNPPVVQDAITGEILEASEEKPYVSGLLYISAVAYVAKEPEPNEPLTWNKRMWGELVAYHNRTLPYVEVGGKKYAYVLHPDITGVHAGNRQYRLPGWASTGAPVGAKPQARAGAPTCWSEVNQGLGVPCPNVGYTVNKASVYDEWDQWLMHNAYWEPKTTSGVTTGKYCSVTSVVSSLPCTMFKDYWSAQPCCPGQEVDYPSRILAFGGYAEGDKITSVFGNSYGKAVSGTHKHVQGGRKVGSPWIITLACPMMPEALLATNNAVNKIGR